MAVNYHNYSRFSWSFTGYLTQKDAENALASMQAWFDATYDKSEWQVTGSVYFASQAFGAKLEAQREVQQLPEEKANV